MTEEDRPAAGPVSWPRVGALVLAGCAAAALGTLLPAGPALESWYLAFVTAFGLSVGSLALLMFGHIMGEDWLDPVRSAAEAASRTVPLLVVFALPLAFRLPELFAWAGPAPPGGLTSAERGLLQPGPFLLRAGVFLAVWSALAYWITGSRRPRRASAVGIAILAVTVDFATLDWVLSREPLFRSGLYPFAFAMTQLLAALAGAILVSLGRGQAPEAFRMVSLERALIVLILLALWTWFAQFLIVWLANLPDEAAWYLRRSAAWPWLVLLVGAVAALGVALLILVPVGTGPRIIMVGAGLALAAHGAFMVWLLRPAAPALGLTLWDLGVPSLLALLWGIWFAAALRRRPHEPSGQGQAGTSSAGTAV